MQGGGQLVLEDGGQFIGLPDAFADVLISDQAGQMFWVRFKYFHSIRSVHNLLAQYALYPLLRNSCGDPAWEKEKRFKRVLRKQKCYPLILLGFSRVVLRDLEKMVFTVSHQIPGHLLRQQFLERGIRRRSFQHRSCPHDAHGVSQQAHRPGQSQAIQEHLAKTKLVFLVRLGGFDPWPHLLKHVLRRAGA